MPWSSYGGTPVERASARHTLRRTPRAWLVFAALALILAALAAQPRATVRAAATVFAADSFSRTVSGGWGQADVGGSYTMGGKASDLSVGSGDGRMGLSAPGVSRSALLNSVWQRDVDLTFTFSLAQRPSGGSIWIYGVARQVSAGTQYFAKVRVDANGTVTVGASRVVGSSETPLGTGVTLAASYSAGSTWKLHASFSNASPTSIGVSAWPTSASPPSAWQFTAQDSTSALQAAGSIGLFTYATSSNSDDLYFDDYSVVSAAASSPPPPSGANYYVSTTGNDANPGTLSSPWRSLQKAADTVPAGATVNIRGGTYGSFVMRRSGTSSTPITFSSYGTETAVVDGAGNVDYTIKVVGAQYLRFSRLTIRGGYAAGYAGAGITTEKSNHIEILDNKIHNNHSWGVRLYNSNQITVDGNEVTGNAVGIHVNLAGEGDVISNNQVHDNNQLIVGTPCSVNCGDDVGGEGIALVKSTGHLVVSGNSIWANRAVSSDWGYDGAAFSVYGASNWTMRDNVTWNNRNVMETGTDANRTPCDNNQFVRNLNYAATTVDVTVGLVLRCASNTLIANNTFVGMQNFFFDISHNQGTWGGSIDGLRILNNIISGPAKAYGIGTWPLPSSVAINYNLINRTGTGNVASVIGKGDIATLSTFRSITGYEANGLTGDPRFVDPANNDYHLRSDSPAIDHGRVVSGVTDGYRGGAPDMGRFEY